MKLATVTFICFSFLQGQVSKRKRDVFEPQNNFVQFKYIRGQQGWGIMPPTRCGVGCRHCFTYHPFQLEIPSCRSHFWFKHVYSVTGARFWHIHLRLKMYTSASIKTNKNIVVNQWLASRNCVLCFSRFFHLNDRLMPRSGSAGL